jgi:dolichyl-phosphate beta-glucosyltransferase
MTEEAVVRPSVTIVLPAYNEAERIEPALRELYGYLYRGGPARQGGRSSAELGVFDVLIVDDGSRDDTIGVVERFVEQQSSEGREPAISMLRRPHLGKGAAVTAGVMAATGDLVVFADADMATPPDQIPLLTSALETNEVALGSRIQPDGSDRRTSQPWYRRMLGRIYRAIASAWITGDVPDTQCGFKGFRREAARDLFGNLKTTGIVFDAELIFLSRRRGYSMAIVPIMWHDVRGSRMRLRPRLALQVLFDLARIPIIHRHVPRAAKIR